MFHRKKESDGRKSETSRTVYADLILEDQNCGGIRMSLNRREGYTVSSRAPTHSRVASKNFCASSQAKETSKPFGD
jgi:hypothetical protein